MFPSSKRKIISIEETRKKIIELLYDEMKYVFGPLAGGDKGLLDQVMESLISKIDKVLDKKETSLVGIVRITISRRKNKDFYELVYCRIDISDILYDYFVLEGHNPTMDEIRRKYYPHVILEKRGSAFRDTFTSHGEIRGYISVDVSVSKPSSGKPFIKTVSDILSYYFIRRSTKYLEENALKMIMRYRKFKEHLKHLIGEKALMKNQERNIAKIFRYTVEMKINDKIPAILLLLGDTSIEKDPSWVRVLIVTRKKAIYCIERYNRGRIEENPGHGQRLIIREFTKLDKSSFPKLIGSIFISFPDLWVSVDAQNLQDILFAKSY